MSAIEYFTEMKMKDTNFKSNVHLHTGLHVKTHNRNHIAKRRNAVNAYSHKKPCKSKIEIVIRCVKL